MSLERDAQSRTYVRHPSNQLTHYIRDSFVDPWKPHETILIQHGFGRHGEFWYHWIPVLSRHYHVIRRDLRGHGYSSFPKEGEEYEYSVDGIIGEIVDTLDQLGLEKVHFLGESTGGMLGEIMAAKYAAFVMQRLTANDLLGTQKGCTPSQSAQHRPISPNQPSNSSPSTTKIGRQHAANSAPEAGPRRSPKSLVQSPSQTPTISHGISTKSASALAKA